MSEIGDKDLYEALGRAVCASQIFEFSFICAVRLALNQPNVMTLEDVAPISLSRSFKQPVAALLREISGSEVMPQNLADRITDWIEIRNEVVHRQLALHGWPTEAEQEKLKVYFEKCKIVERDGLQLSLEFIPLLVQWLHRFPNMELLAKEQAQFLKLMEQRDGVRPYI